MEHKHYQDAFFMLNKIYVNRIDILSNVNQGIVQKSLVVPFLFYQVKFI